MDPQHLFPVPLERFSEEDLALARAVSDWADRAVLGPRATSKENYDGLLRRAWVVLQGDLGLAGALLPEALGGAGRDGPDAAYALTLAAEEVGRADLGLAFSLACTQAVTATAVLGPGAVEGGARLGARLPAAPLPAARLLGASLLAGETPEVALVMPAFATSEAAGPLCADGRAPQVRARLENGGFVLEAPEARPLHAGATASHFAMVCAADEATLLLALVPAQTPGLRRGERLLQTGLTASPSCLVHLAGVRLGEEHLLASGEEGLRYLQTWLRLLTAAGAVGALRAAHAILADWGEHRVIKGRGQVFKENPLTASLMADLATRLHTGRLLVHDLAHFVAHPETYGRAGAEPVHVTGVNVFRTVTASAEAALGHTMELMASAGYAREWFLERYWRDLKCVRGLLGGEMLSRMAVARHAYACDTL